MLQAGKPKKRCGVVSTLILSVYMVILGKTREVEKLGRNEMYVYDQIGLKQEKNFSYEMIIE